MKKIILLNFLLLLIGCNNETSIEENKLSLTAPSNEVIAGSLGELQQRIGRHIAEECGIDEKFEITNIHFSPEKKGYFAIIDYELADGRTCNMAIAKNVVVSYIKEGIPVVLNLSSRGIDGDMTITCEKEEACRTSCKIKGVYEDGKNKVSCVCGEEGGSGCAIRVK